MFQDGEDGLMLYAHQLISAACVVQVQVMSIAEGQWSSLYCDRTAAGTWSQPLTPVSFGRGNNTMLSSPKPDNHQDLT